LDLKEVVWEGVDRIHLAQDRDQWRALVDTVMNHRFPWNPEDFLTSFSRSLLHGISSVLPTYK
jgi:hypothetical protein